jgi:hypothetical protein
MELFEQYTRSSIKCPAIVGSNPSSYSGDTGLKSRPEDRLLQGLRGLLKPSRQIPGKYIKLDHHHFSSDHPNNRRYRVSATDSVVKYP